MRQLRAWASRFKGLFLKDSRDRDFADELESHLEMHIDDNIRAGMSREEARRVAIMKLGGVDQTKEAYRDRSTIPSRRMIFLTRSSECCRRTFILRPSRMLSFGPL